MAMVVRYLGPEQFGLLSYFISFIALFEPFVYWGMNSVVRKYLIYGVENKKYLLGTSFVFQLFSAIWMCILIYIITSFHEDVRDNRLICLILSIELMFKTFDLVNVWYESQVKSKYSAIIKTVTMLIASIFKLLLIHYKCKLVYFAFAMIAESVLFPLGCIYILKKHGNSIFEWRFSFSILKKILKESWPLFLSGLAILVYMKIDQIMLKHLIGDKAVGIYAAAIKLSEPWYYIAIFLSVSLTPTLTKAKKISLGDYYKKLQKIFGLMTAISLVIMLPIFFLSPYIVTFIFKDRFIEAAPILAIHIWAVIFVFWGVAEDPWDVIEGHTKFVLLKTVTAALLNIALNFVLIPKYSGVGAAWATVISYAFSSCLLNIFHKKARKAFYFQLKSFCFWKYIKM